MNKEIFKPLDIEDAKLNFDNMEANVSYFSSGALKKEFNSNTFEKFFEDFQKQIEKVS